MMIKNLLGLCLIICFINISQITCLSNDTTSTAPPTTTTTPIPDVTNNYTIYYTNNSTQACLRAKFALAFDIQYDAVKDNVPYNATARITLDKPDSYTGSCSDSVNTLTIMFLNNWELTLNYTLKNKNEYSLDIIDLTYFTDPKLFPNITDAAKGQTQKVNSTNLDEFSASKGNSYKCTSKTKVDLGSGVQAEFTNYQGQPFISPDSKSGDFDTAIECSADTAGTSKLVPIIVGSTLALLVILVLVAYVVGRHKHKTGYQQV